MSILFEGAPGATLQPPNFFICRLIIRQRYLIYISSQSDSYLKGAPMWGSKTKKRKKKGKKSETNLCEDCIPAKCCMYFSIEIYEPEDKTDYDDLLWIIAPRDTEIYINDDLFYLLVKSP